LRKISYFALKKIIENKHKSARVTRKSRKSIIMENKHERYKIKRICSGSQIIW